MSLILSSAAASCSSEPAAKTDTGTDMKAETNTPRSLKPTAKPGRRTGMWLIPAAFLLLVVVVGSWFLTSTRVQYVVPGEVLRSRQLEPDELRDAIEEHGLRTVISLRGSPPGEQWPDEQRAVCARNGVGYESTHFSVDEWPAQHEVRRLVHLFETADQPILIHCYRGADRTGWAAAVKLLLEGRDLDDALVHLSPRYGHVCNRDSCPLHFFFDSYQSHLGRRALAGGSEDFRVWVLEYYCPEPYNAGLSLVSEIPMRVSPGERIRATVRAVNNGSFSWRMTDLETTGVRLGARRIGPFDVAPENAIDIFRTPDGPAVDLARAGLEFGVMAPGNQRNFELRFKAPTQPGIYVIQVDMVNELVHWFSDLGFPGLVYEVEVVDPDGSDLPPVGAQ